MELASVSSDFSCVQVPDEAFRRFAPQFRLQIRDSAKSKCIPWIDDVSFISIDIASECDRLCVDRETGIIHLAWDRLDDYFCLSHIE